MGTKGLREQAAHGPGSGRAGGGRSRIPLGSKHRPSMAVRPPALGVLRPHRGRMDSWSCEYGRGGEEARGGEAGRRGKGGLLGPYGPHALPEVQPRALDPGSWIPWSHSWPLALSLQPGTVQAREAPSSWGKGVGTEGKRVKERNPLQHTWRGGQGREREEPSSRRKVCGGVSFKVT